MTGRRTLLRAVRLALVGLVAMLVVPGGAVQPATISLHSVETAKGVDFSDGQLWVLTGPAGGETRGTPPTALPDGRKVQLRFTRFNVSANSFESRMETSYDGGASWRPGNHQSFKRAAGGRTVSEGRLRYRKPVQNYVPLT